MELEIISPEKVCFSGQVKSVSLPGTCGAFTMLTNHAPIISSLTSGVIACQTADGKELAFKIGGGFISSEKNKITVCLESVE